MVNDGTISRKHANFQKVFHGYCNNYYYLKPTYKVVKIV